MTGQPASMPSYGVASPRAHLRQMRQAPATGELPEGARQRLQAVALCVHGGLQPQQPLQQTHSQLRQTVGAVAAGACETEGV